MISLILILVASDVLVSPSLGISIQSSQDAHGLRKWETGRSCFEYTEYCLGTSTWCALAQYYKKEGWDSQESCFEARSSQGSWEYINTDCLADFNACDGTDVMCSRIKHPTYRASCFKARTKGVFLEPYSKGCLGAGRDDDERCTGTKSFCEAPARIEAYGSTEACLSFRGRPAAEEKSKLPFLHENFRQCFGDPTEECRGTEKFCETLPKAKRRQCFASRRQPPFLHVYSALCGGQRQGSDESCMGTLNYCGTKDRISLYGSKEACVKYRGSPQPVSWLQPVDQCLDPAMNLTEACKGTEVVCQTYTPNPEECFASRGPAPFLLPNSVGSAEHNVEQEQSLGTDTWCHERYRELNYISENACFLRRAFDQDKLLTQAIAIFKGIFKAAVLKNAHNITLGAVVRALVVKRGDASAGLNEVRASLGDYMDAVETRLIQQCVTKYLASIRASMP